MSNDLANLLVKVVETSEKTEASVAKLATIGDVLDQNQSVMLRTQRDQEETRKTVQKVDALVRELRQTVADAATVARQDLIVRSSLSKWKVAAIGLGVLVLVLAGGAGGVALSPSVHKGIVPHVITNPAQCADYGGTAGSNESGTYCVFWAR